MKITFFSGARSEYYLLKALLRAFEAKQNTDHLTFVSTIVFGGVYKEKDDLTWREKEQKYLHSKNIHTFDVTLITEDPQPTASAQISKSIETFDYYLSLEKRPPDLLVVLGDRAETLGACISAVSHLIPIAHLCGGESTIGAVDDWIRHSITKMASLHFPTSKKYRSRIIKMGETPDLVFNFGHPIADMHKDTPLLNREQLNDKFPEIIDKRLVTVTVHPETANRKKLQAFETIKKYIIHHPDLYFIVTGSNSDEGGYTINSQWKSLVCTLGNMNFYDTLGSKLYLSFLSCSEFALGNSSSLLIDTHITKTPAVVVGNRQDGRRFASGTIRSGYDDLEDKVIQLYREKDTYFYDSDYVHFGACKKIAEIILKTTYSLSVKKEFFDV